MSRSSTKSACIQTDTGNLVSRSCVICGSSNIVLGGKSILQPGCILRGDLRRAGAGATTAGGREAATVAIAMGKYCNVGEGTVLRPCYKTYKGVFTYYPMKIGDYVTIGANSVVEAASIGNGVEIGKGCIIGPLAILKDICRIAAGAVVGAGTIVPSLTECAGSPARPSRYVHDGCLLSWRTSVKAESFYAYSTHALAILISLGLAILSGFLADPLLRLTEHEMLSFGSEQLPHHWFDEHLAAGDALRETASFTGFLLRDCTWSSAREPYWEQEMTISEDPTPLPDPVINMNIQDVKVRRNLTNCGRFWRKRSDDEAQVQGVRKAVLHVARGFSLSSLARAFVGRLVRQYFLLAITLRMVLPSLGGKLPYNSFADLISASWLGIDASFFADVIKMVRRRAKVARSRDQIASWWQFPLVMCTFFTAFFAFRSILSFSQRIVKAALARVESLVIDLSEEADSVEREKVE
ncbi:hypothetical protein NBRC10513v2_005894 [Rhodotorula toruloides]